MEHRQVHNLIGPQIRRIRCRKDWSQEQLASRLHDFGLNICRQRLARIEAREACVNDFEIVILTKALEVTWEDLLPKTEREPLYRTLSRILAGQFKLLPTDTFDE